MGKGWVLLSVVALAAFGQSETLVTKAKIAEVTERGFVLTIGTETVPVQDESATRFWKDRQPAKRDAFTKGDTVTVRLKTDTAPTVLREIADVPTNDWLAGIRRDPVSGTIKRVDLKYLTLKLDSGGEFAYRYSEKSKVTLAGKAVAVADLTEGQRLWVKGRLLPTLDTWVVAASDQKIASTSSAEKKEEKGLAPLKIGASGVIKGVVDLHQPQYSMIDLFVDGRLIHSVYTPKTTFKLDGAKAQPSDIARGLRVEITYRKDQFGRLVASKIELFHASGP